MIKQAPLQFSEPALDGSGLKIGMIVARYNSHVTAAMLKLAQDELLRLQVATDDISIISVPGSYELPAAAQAMLHDRNYDAIICFGCVMKGETRHDVLVGDAAAQGLQRVSLDTGTPIIFGVICAENQRQATERIERGRECAQAAIEMAHTVQSLKKLSIENATNSIR
ncbi:6,7-dimethyl-8-ribityllumazine synthase [Ktedonosporobacter rubrisoli]|uniref:6,7-dimethyl-8-ribityllumazine synthase n=1 Tax=Ktedonosporobacter rubrisoli TaxID=2509675 RepID=A0A4P6K6A5_KTERU|nr:6,7-dimethyl-8-ribityllumazine synthase [Ktedonosporobacter rubrisoli]QBD83116.1 6,7-dimethyl-8-ribityllumazine synthase [Ktedonosporobacter rubrisoli]